MLKVAFGESVSVWGIERGKGAAQKGIALVVCVVLNLCLKLRN